MRVNEKKTDFGKKKISVFNVYYASVRHFFKQKNECQSSSYKRDTVLTILCYVNTAQVIFLFTFGTLKRNSRFKHKMNVANPRNCLFMFKTIYKQQTEKNSFKMNFNRYVGKNVNIIEARALFYIKNCELSFLLIRPKPKLWLINALLKQYKQ